MLRRRRKRLPRDLGGGGAKGKKIETQSAVEGQLQVLDERDELRGFRVGLTVATALMLTGGLALTGNLANDPLFDWITALVTLPAGLFLLGQEVFRIRRIGALDGLIEEGNRRASSAEAVMNSTMSNVDEIPGPTETALEASHSPARRVFLVALWVLFAMASVLLFVEGRLLVARDPMS